MKNRVLTLLLALTVGMAFSTPALAIDEGPLNAAADVLVVRPACFAATVVGSAVFVVALPFAALSKSVHSTARTLVVKPARATFTRPVGDMTGLTD